MISPRTRNRHQDKHHTYPTPGDPDASFSSTSWQPTQQTSGVRFESEQLDLNGRASPYNSNYVSTGGARDQQLDPKLRRSQTLPDHLNPDTSSFRAPRTQNGNDNFSDSPYSRAPFANMTSGSSPNFRDGQSAGNSHENHVVTSGLGQRNSRQVFNPEEVSQPTNLNTVPEDRVLQHPDERQLPPRDVTPETIEEAYVSFILCCNPSVPLSTDSVELRRGFNSPPKSDGKTFQTFTLFELIRKLEMKELKTWAQLAMELGVEPPVLEKGQSAQKVQQYAVRLKRWMHAMHVDAFFEYLLGKSHVYWTQIPSAEDGVSEFGRDGVPPEEDLALRALLPETRPKRGRRKAEDRDNEYEDSRSPAQRPRLNSPTLSEDFALARSAHPDHTRRFDDGLSPWSTEPASSTAQNMRWRLDDSIANTPLSAHPQSAVVSRAANPFLTPENEPRSAVTPTTTRSRRRHGPAVSSAWPSSGNNSSGKLRGRPPSNRSITDGPFSTFPANPNTKVGQTINLRDNTPSETPVADSTDEPMFSFPPTFTTAWRSKNGAQQKPAGLQLQVPERVGGTVRLATPPPPPTVLINGGAESSPNSSSLAHNTSASTQSQHAPISGNENDIMEYLSSSRREENHQSTNNVSDQQQEPSMSSRTPTPNETQIQTPNAGINLTFKDDAGADRTNMDDLESHFRLRVLSAEWTDINGTPCESCTIETANQIVKQTIRNLREESTTPEAFLINLAALAGGRTLMTKLKMKVVKVEVVGEGTEREKRTTFESRWTLKFGAVEGSFTIQQTCKEKMPSLSATDEMNNDRRDRGRERVAGEVTTAEDGDGDDVDADDAKMWKRKYLELQNRFYMKDDRVWGIRQSVLDALAATASEHVV